MKSVKFLVACFDGKPRKKGERYFIEDHLANSHILAKRAVAVDAEGQTVKDKPEVIKEKKEPAAVVTVFRSVKDPPGEKSENFSASCPKKN